ncbi:MAG: hypothetical protein JWL77_2142 [Chthonomonadaceae bacterium]|nr:hypothetical protein [Chthonomonadaceae bacterium]
MSSTKFAGGLKQITCICFTLAVCGTAGAQTLFYSGDLSNNAIANQIIPPTTDFRTFDVFQVNSPLGWNIATLFSNDIQFGSPVDVTTQAAWSIRTGMSAGGPTGGGTVLFGGTAAATQTATGRNGGTEYTIGVDVSALHILLAPGTYWLEVTPIGGTKTWFNSTTSGANGVNALNGNTGLFSNAGASYINENTDFSLGITGTAVTPEGSSLAMLALGGLPLVVGFGRKFRRRKTA